MRYCHVCLEGFGYALPEEVVTSLDIERQLAPIYERFGLHEGRLELMSGIRERRIWDGTTLPSDAATRAGRHALEVSGTDPREIGCLIHAAVSRDCLEPATASIVHAHLGMPPEAMLFDVSNACLGFVNAMLLLANMIELGQIQKGLIVAGESSRHLLESTLNDLLGNPDLARNQLKLAIASLTIGSGAAALVMTHDSCSKAKHRFLGGVARASTTDHQLCRGSADTGFSPGSSMLMNTDAELLLTQGCRLAGETWEQFKTEMGWKNSDVQRCFTHQVGVAHRDRLYETIGLDVALDFSTFEFLGNVGSVSLPLTMAMGLEKHNPRRGERIAMLGIGSGLNCIMLGVEW